MKILIAGPRGFEDEQFIHEELDACFDGTTICDHDVIVTGGARGVDTFAKNWAELNNLKTETYKPEYDKYPGKQAPLIRNDEMAQICGYGFIFWSGVHGGTQHAMSCLAKHGKSFRVVALPYKKG